MTDRLELARLELEARGAKHAPIQRIAGDPFSKIKVEGSPRAGDIDARYVTVKDGPGIYFLLGTDNGHQQGKLTDRIQIIFLDVPVDLNLADGFGYCYSSMQRLPVADKSMDCFAMMLEPL